MSAADDEAGTESWASGSRTSFGHACESTSAQVPKMIRLSENSKQKETMRTCEKESANSINEGKEKTKESKQNAKESEDKERRHSISSVSVTRN